MVAKKWQERFPLLGLIGDTSLVEIGLFQREAPKAKICLKCEWENPGGSLKDRPVAEMLTAALDSGELSPGKTILDSSSGNAGIAYAWIGAALGFPVEVVIPANASRERFLRLLAHGAKVTKTDPLLGYDEALRRAHALYQENPQKYYLANQYANPANWRSHYKGTGGEIWRAWGRKVTHFVCGVGTGGSLTGIGRRLKEENPRMKVIMISTERFPGIEGLKPLGEPQDIVPEILDESVVDEKIPVTSEEGARFCERLARRGLFAGLSTGAYLSGVAKLLREEPKARIVTLGCDTGERYFSTGLWKP